MRVDPVWVELLLLLFVLGLILAWGLTRWRWPGWYVDHLSLGSSERGGVSGALEESLRQVFGTEGSETPYERAVRRTRRAGRLTVVLAPVVGIVYIVSLFL